MDKVHTRILAIETLIFHSALLSAVLQPWSYSWPPLNLYLESTRCLKWQHTLRFLSLPFCISPLFHPKWGRTQSLLKWGCQIWRGSQLLLICANGTTRRPVPEAFDGAKSAHAHKNRLIITSWKIRQTAVVDLEHRWAFEDISLSIAPSKNYLSALQTYS